MFSALPKVRMKLEGADGNAFAILQRFAESARRQGWDKESIDNVMTQATSGDYNNLIYTMLQYVDDSVAEQMQGSYFEDEEELDEWGYRYE